MTTKSKLHNKIMSYLLILLPILMITGPFLSDLAVILICILYLLSHFKKEIQSYLKNYIFITFLIFYFLCIISSLLSEYPLISSTKSVFYIRFLFFSLAIVYILNSNTDTLYKLFISILLCFSILIFDGFYQFIFKKNLIGFEMYQGRISSFFKDELIYGSYLSKFLPIFLSLFFFLKPKNYKLNIYFSIVFILSTFAITISGERSALFLVIITLSYLLFMLKLKFQTLMIFFILIFLGISSLLILNKSIHNRLIIFTKNQIVTENKIFFFSEDHTGHYNSAIDIYKNNNKIIGIGPKNYRNYCYNNDKYKNKPFICSSHPHNTYIQILLETGIIGFLILITTFFVLVYFSAKHLYFKLFKNKFLFNNSQISLMAFYITVLWPIAPTGSFFNNYLSIIYFLPAGLLIWSLKKQSIE